MKYEIIDAHTHVYPDKIAEKASQSVGSFYNLPMCRIGTAERLLQNVEKLGMSRFAICSVATTKEQVVSINNYLASECKAHPEFFGFGAMHPEFENVEAEIERMIKSGLRGIKMHPDFQKFNIDSDSALEIYQKMEGKLPLLVHLGDGRYSYSRPYRLARVAKLFPKLKIQASHLGGYQRWDEAAECLKGLPNIRFDTSSSISFIGCAKARELVLHYGVENCMFGTDFPMWDTRDEYCRFISMGFSEKENQQMFSETWKDFFEV